MLFPDNSHLLFMVNFVNLQISKLYYINIYYIIFIILYYIIILNSYKMTFKSQHLGGWKNTKLNYDR